MSSSPISDVLGLRLTSHECVEDYEQLMFDGGVAILSIYNPYEVRSPQLGSGQAINSVIGQRLLTVTARPGLVELSFEGGWMVNVDVREEAFTGPEAMVLHQQGKSPVVWT